MSYAYTVDAPVKSLKTGDKVMLAAHGGGYPEIQIVLFFDCANSSPLTLAK